MRLPFKVHLPGPSILPAAAATIIISISSSSSSSRDGYFLFLGLMAVPSAFKSDATSAAGATVTDSLFIHQGIKERDNKEEDE